MRRWGAAHTALDAKHKVREDERFGESVARPLEKNVDLHEESASVLSDLCGLDIDEGEELLDMVPGCGVGGGMAGIKEVCEEDNEKVGAGVLGSVNDGRGEGMRYSQPRHRRVQHGRLY